MALGAILGAALTDHSTRDMGLYLDGFDVADSPTSTAPYGVDPRDLTVVEAGPGQVSSLTAIIDDTTSVVPVYTGMMVRMHDHAMDLPIFLGYVQSWRRKRVGLGSRITLRAAGIETLLDWLYVPAMTLAAGTDYNAGVQSIAAQAIGVGTPALNTADNGTTHLSSVAFPVGTGFGGVTTTDVFTWAGGTLRQALTAYGAFLVAQAQAGFDFSWSITVDFYGGLRFFRLTPSTGSSGRLDQQTVTLSTAGTFKPADTDYGVNEAGTPRSVWVTGAGAGTGAVSDGTGLPGPTIAISDPNSTTAAARNAIGLQALGEPDYVASGRVRWEGAILSSTPSTASKRAGDYVSILDAQVGLPAATKFPMQQIAKTWAPSGEETWVIDFGGELPQATKLIRRLTRHELAK